MSYTTPLNEDLIYNKDTKKGNEFTIPLCLIEIWEFEEGKSGDPLKEPENPMILAEVEDIEIEDSFKELITGATVKFPRGTIVHRTLTPADFSTKTEAMVTEDGVVTRIESNENAKLLDPDDFKVGYRIRIRLGSTSDPAVAKMTAYNSSTHNIYSSREVLDKYKGYLRVMFEGYITKVSLETPIQLECENLASGLKFKSCPNHPGKSTDSVNFFLGDEKGEMNLLKDTGLKLYPKTRKSNIDLGKIRLTKELVMADLFDIWAKRKVYSFIRREGGNYYVCVGRPYVFRGEGDSILRLGEVKAPPIIDFNWHVAENGLTMNRNNPKFVAVEAQSLNYTTGKDSFEKVVVTYNPSYNPNEKGSEKYRIISESKLSKKAMQMGQHYLCTSQEGINLRQYNIIPYFSKTVNISREKLAEEAVKYLETYNPIGIEGTLTLFGDLCLTAGTSVFLQDPVHPAKNGTYLIESVKTSFGVKGFRQTITLPYCIQRKADPPYPANTATAKG